MVCSRGQTSIEVLLVVSFVLVVSLAIVIPYVDNQNITNATFVAKLTILPFIEKNSLRIKLNSVIPEVDSALNEITLHIKTTGRWSNDVDLELSFPTAGRPSGCEQVCNAVANLNAYSAVHLDWSHNDAPYCGSVSC